jgi:glucose-1-phosphate adenylyltransferase
MMVREHRVLAHSFRDEGTGRQAYWRDVGTIDSYWQANMDLLDERSELDLYDRHWPIWTHQPLRSPSLFTGDGSASRSIVAAGSVVAGRVERSVLFAESAVGAGSAVTGSLVLPKARVGRDCRLQNVIVDSGCEIPDGSVIGFDAIDDAVAYDVSAGGVVLVTEQRMHGRGNRAALPERTLVAA